LPDRRPAPPFETPGGLALDSAGNLYCAEYGANQIVKITPSGTLSVVAGTGSPGNPTPGPALDSRLDEPAGVAVDHSGNLYIADDTNQRVEKVTPSGTLSVFAGTGGYATAVPGPATSSPLDDPSDVAVNAAGDVYVSMESSVIAKITPSGTLSIVAGSGHYGGATPGPATSSKLEWPFGLSFDGAGDLYFSDYDLSQIFKLTPSGTLSVVAGTGSYGAATEGPPTASELGGPEGVAVDSAGNVYIADTFNNRVEGITGLVPAAPGAVTTTATSSAVTVTWSAPSSGPAPTSYTVTPIVNGVAGTPVVVTGTRYVLSDPVAGDTYQFEVTADSGGGSGPATESNTVTVPASSTASGYWLVGGDGGVFSYGTHFYGSTGNLTLNQPVFAITSTKDGKGYWFVARDGGVFSYGDAKYHGSVPSVGVHVTDIVGMAEDEATGGYWLVGRDGGVYAFDAPFHGSVPELGDHVADIVGITATADGGGYDLVSSTGAVYSFGDARYHGGANTMAHLNAPVVGISLDAATGGYWEAGSDGGVYAYDAPFDGSAGGLHLSEPVVGISATPSGSGYWLVGADGGVFAEHAPYLGSMGGKHLNSPVVGITAAG
jgi:sugar lactone lactonase YvrE